VLLTAIVRLKNWNYIDYEFITSIFQFDLNVFFVSGILQQDMLHQLLITCCLEIVLFSYNSQKVFPWILEVFPIQPFYFYKVTSAFEYYLLILWSTTLFSYHPITGLFKLHFISDL